MADDDDAPAEPGVMGSLPHTRPQRASTRRSTPGTAGADKPTDTERAATRAAGTAPAKKGATRRAPAKKAAARKPPAKKAATGKATSKQAAPKKAAASETAAAPRAVRPGARDLGRDTPQAAAGSERSGGSAELVTGAARAVGQVAQLGIAVGAQAMRKAASRLPGRS